MEKWDIRPAPTSFDPLRHLLLLKGDMKDVSAVLRKFGSICGRPSPESTPEGFNFSLPLHGMSTAAVERLSAALNEMTGLPATGGFAIRALPEAPALGATAAPPPAPAPAPAAPPPAPVPVPAAMTVPAEPAPPSPTVTLPPLGSSSLFEPAAMPAVAPALAPVPSAVPAPEPAVAAAAPLISLSPAPPPAPAPTPAPAVTGTAGEAGQVAAQLTFTYRQGLDALLTFDTLLVGPYNRFAHAAATSVVGSPGSMYNPLFLYGAPGVGKSHFMHSVAKGLCGSLGEANVVLTSGMRLSQAVSQALAAGTYNTLKKSVLDAKALVVDDVHLIAVTEQNRSALAELFGHFFSNGLQVVLSSLYPARALGGLEEALKISLSKGWAVDLKVPSPMVQVDILQGWLDRRGCQLNTDDTRLFHERIGTNYSDALRWMRRMLALLKLGQQRGQTQKPVELLNLLFDPGVAAADFPSDAELARVRAFQPPPAGENAMPLALVVPKGAESLAPWVAAGFHSAQTQFGVATTYKHVLLQAYDASQPFGVPFQVADACHRAGARAVLVVGPPNDTPLAAKAGEFSHAVIHALSGIGIACGWIGHRGTMAPANHLRAHLDFAAERS